MADYQAVKIPRSAVICARCDRPFFIDAHVVVVKLGRRLCAVHPTRRCWSPVEDAFVRQGQISANGKRVGPVRGA